MKLGLGGSKQDPYLQCHEINTSIAQGGWWSHCCSEEEQEREKEREEGEERGEEGGDEGGDEKGDERGEEEGPSSPPPPPTSHISPSHSRIPLPLPPPNPSPPPPSTPPLPNIFPEGPLSQLDTRSGARTKMFNAFFDGAS